MKNVRRIRIGLVACLVASGLALPTVATHATPAAPAAGGLPRPSDDATGSIDVAPAQPDAPAQPRLDAVLTKRLQSADEGSVTVEVVGVDASIAAAVTDAGGTLGRGGGGVYSVTVPARQLGHLAASTGISQVRTPIDIRAMTESHPPVPEGGWQGLSGYPVESWMTRGYKGAGSKVGVIGLFDTTVLATEQAGGEVPPIPSNHETCITSGAICPFGTPGQTWGNSLLEIVNDGAPEAPLYLAELGRLTDYYPVIDWFAANGVTIVMNPFVWPYDGVGNGTGPAAAIVDYAVSKGITWFNTAGDLAPSNWYTSYRGGHWSGLWSDPNNNRWLNFSGTDESLSIYCGSLLGLRWKDSGVGALTDYDLYITDYNIATHGNGVKKLLSGSNQAAGALPLEGNTGLRLCNTDPTKGPVYDGNKDGFISLWVQRTTRNAGSPTGDLFEIAANYGWLEYSTAEYSAGIPFADSTNPGEITVTGFSPGGQDWPSPGAGPTLDGRVKPDLVGYNCITTTLTGYADQYCNNSGYYGTEAAVATQVGWAAIARAGLKIEQPKDLVRYMTARNTAGVTPTSTQGYGWGQMYNSHPPVQGVPTHFVPSPSPQRILDTRPTSGGPIGVPTGTPMTPDQILNFTVPGFAGGQVTATAAVLNVTLVRATNYGYLQIYPLGGSYPGATSVLNAVAGQVRANTVVVPLGYSGQMSLYSSGGGHVIVDLLGFMEPESAEGTLGFTLGSGRLHPTTPTRVLDSRACIGIAACSGEPYPADTFVDLGLKGFVDPADAANVIPADATSVALSVTVDTPAAVGYMSVIPGGQTTTPTSNLNYDAGASLTTTVFVGLHDSPTGDVRVYLQRSAHLQVEVLGWFTGATGVGEQRGMFVPMTPTRLLDTRQPPHSKPIAHESVPVDATVKGVPTDAIAIMINNVSVSSVAPGEVQASATVPGDTPTFRNLSFPIADRVIAAATLTTLDRGAYELTTSASTHLVSDAFGYFISSRWQPFPTDVVTIGTHAANGDPISAPLIPHAASANGEFVIFFSYATALDATPTGTHWYRWQRSTGESTELPYASDGGVSISDDGKVVAFETYAHLTPAEANEFGMLLYAVNLDTLALQFVSRAPNGYSSHLAPDGLSIVSGYVFYDRLDFATHVHTPLGLPTTTSLAFTSSPEYAITFNHNASNCLVTRTRVSTLVQNSVNVPNCTFSGPVAYSADGSEMLVGDMSGAFRAVDLDTGAIVALAPTDLRVGGLRSVRLSTNGDFVYMTATDNGRFFRTNTATGVTTGWNLTANGDSLNGQLTFLVYVGDGSFAIAGCAATNLQSTPVSGLCIIDLTKLPAT